MSISILIGYETRCKCNHRHYDSSSWAIQCAVTFSPICVLVDFEFSYSPETSRCKDDAWLYSIWWKKISHTRKPCILRVSGLCVTLGYKVTLNLENKVLKVKCFLGVPAWIIWVTFTYFVLNTHTNPHTETHPQLNRLKQEFQQLR